MNSKVRSHADDKLIRFESLKAKFDAYGVAVRAGAITPADMEDADAIPAAPQTCPAMTPAVNGAWKEDKGYRRPITLLQKVSQPQSESGPSHRAKTR
jgi:hypothetical protein